MGVDGFWPIVSSNGKQVTLEILSDKIIAVDASIWIYQFANALRDATGEQVKASHIVGFFKRICKLLFLRIKPVFVFDGPPIPLKFAALRKRRDDTVPDSVFRKAAQQILAQNLQALMSNPQKALKIPQQPIRPDINSDSDLSVDEIHVLTDSSSDGESLSPSRRLRLSVPEEFRGFVSERRTLDCINLPVSPDKMFPVRERKSDIEVDAAIDTEALKDLPLHEQYRGLLQTRSALLSQGRRKALNLASKMGSAANAPDLDQLSADQIKAVVDLAKVTDLTKSVRMKMSREEHKDEVYVPPELGKSTSSGVIPELSSKRRKKNDGYWLHESDQHSVLMTARLTSRNDLLFGTVKRDEKGTPDEIRPKKEDLDSSDSDFDPSMFGAAWGDIIKNESAPPAKFQVPVVPIPPEEIPNPQAVVEPRSPEPGGPVKDQAEDGQEESDLYSEPVEEALSEEDEPPELVAATSEDEISSLDTESVRTESSLSESEYSETEPEVVAVELPSAPPVFEEPVSDIELNMFLELQDPFPRFTSFIEEEAFDNRVRERITSPAMDDGTAYTEIQELLSAFGIPWVSAPADAEAQCAYLCQHGLVDGVISDDSDTLIYGSPIVFRHLYLGDSTVEIFKLASLGFSQEELVSLALLLGCDFTEGVRGIGPVNATEIVRHYAGLEGLTRFRIWAERLGSDIGKESDPVAGENESNGALREFKLMHANYRSQWLFPDDFPSVEVWNVFTQPVVEHNLEPFTWAVPDEREVIDVVTSFTDMRYDQVDSILSATMTKYREARIQRRITDYFSPAFERGAVAEVVSKRLKAALGKA